MQGSNSGIQLSLHWLVVSFFAISFIFESAAAIIDGSVRVHQRRRRRHLIGTTEHNVPYLQ
jgi:hypothetical protein